MPDDDQPRESRHGEHVACCRADFAEGRVERPWFDAGSGFKLRPWGRVMTIGLAIVFIAVVLSAAALAAHCSPALQIDRGFAAQLESPVGSFVSIGVLAAASCSPGATP